AGAARVDVHRVVAAAAFDGRGAAGWAADDVDGVRLRAAVDQIVTLTAGEQVISVAAVEGERDRAGFERGGVDGVRAAQGIDGETFGRAERSGDPDLGGQPGDRHAVGEVSVNRDRVAVVGTIHGDVVRLAVGAQRHLDVGE